MTGAIISWRAAKGLSMLPYHYPSPIQSNLPALQMTQSVTMQLPTAEEIMKEFPMVFDGQVGFMEGE